jgi:2-hydroxy-3-keto-5-methylthiopentenyl-1-phosphate phosphatase
MVLLEFGDVSIYEASEDALGESLTLHQVIEREFATVKAPLLEVVTWLVENVVVRPGFAELVERFDPLVISSGFHELIEPILAREGLEVELLANRLDPRPEGWRVIWRDESVCEICAEPCKRASLGDEPFVYVGDGYSDRCAALAAERVFARDALAEYLDAKGVAYTPFVTLSEVAASL